LYAHHFSRQLQRFKLLCTLEWQVHHLFEYIPQKNAKRVREYRLQKKIESEALASKLKYVVEHAAQLQKELTEKTIAFEKLLLLSFSTKEKEWIEKEHKLNLEIQSLQQEVQTLKTELQVTKTTQDNATSLIKELPEKSPIRRPILQYFIRRFNKRTAMNLFKISRTTYYRILKEKPKQSILFSKYKIGSKRFRVDLKLINDAKKNLDRVMPYVSG
jgi:hypothetical protein